MKGRGTGFYNPRGLSPVDRAKLDNALGDIADGKVSESDLESALVEIADMWLKSITNASKLAS